MTFESPIWLLLAIPLAASLWFWPMPSRGLSVLRGCLMALLVLGVSGLSVRIPSSSGMVIVLADRSLSMPEDATEKQIQAIALLQKKMGANDRLTVIAFGADAAIEYNGTNHPPFTAFTAEIDREGSDLGGALEKAISLLDRDISGRILLLTDGRWTGIDPAVAVTTAADRGVGVDFRWMERPVAGDLAIAKIEAPMNVSPGESFMITGWIRSPVAQSIDYELQRDNRIISTGKQDMAGGLRPLLFRDTATHEGGPSDYQLIIRPSIAGQADPLPQNNQARAIVTTSGPKPVAVVSENPTSRLADLLTRGGLPAIHRPASGWSTSTRDLANYSAVILENLPADQLGEAGMENLAMWVKETGSGLMMTGGLSSYGPGGYYNSPLEKAMPVSMELRQEHRKFAVAIAVVLDRSGSMAAPASGGRQKMDLANLGTMSMVDLLSPMDELAVIAVDSAPHTIVPMQPIKDKNGLKNRIRRIESTGGGIYVYEGLNAAADMLAKATAGTKHIILFSDAADSEQPGDYIKLLKVLTDSGVTCSVIGLGTERDVDANLLKDIAKRGNGRIMFTQNAQELPRLFAQDTFVVARNSFQKELTPIDTTPALELITGRKLGTPPPVGGYNLCYLKPTATQAVVTLDEYKAPVAANWQYGAGRVLAYTAQVDGQFTGPIAGWDKMGDYLTSLARWTAGESEMLPDQMAARQEIRGGVCRISLYLDPERKTPMLRSKPYVSSLTGRDGSQAVATTIPFHWVNADKLEAEISIRSGFTLLNSIHIGENKPLILPAVAMPYSPEFAPVEPGAGEKALRSMSRATGGAELLDPAQVWELMPRLPRMIPLTPWIFVLGVTVLLLEILERRTGLMSMAGMRTSRNLGGIRKAALATVRGGTQRAAAAKPTQNAPATKAPPAGATQAADKGAKTADPSPSKPESPKPQAPEGSGAMVDAMRKARNRASDRTDGR